MWLDLMAHLDYLHRINSSTRGLKARLDRLDTQVESDDLWVKPKRRRLFARSV